MIDPDDIVQAIADGLTVIQAADRFGVSVDEVRAAQKQALAAFSDGDACGQRNDSGSSPEKNTHIAPFGHSSRRRDDTQRGRGSRPFDVAIFLASYILSTSARIFLAVSNTVLAAAAEHERHMIGEPRSNASAPPPRASSVGRISSLTGRSYRFVRAVSSLSPPLHSHCFART